MGPTLAPAAPRTLVVDPSRERRVRPEPSVSTQTTGAASSSQPCTRSSWPGCATTSAARAASCGSGDEGIEATQTKTSSRGSAQKVFTEIYHNNLRNDPESPRRAATPRPLKFVREQPRHQTVNARGEARAPELPARNDGLTAKALAQARVVRQRLRQAHELFGVGPAEAVNAVRHDLPLPARVVDDGHRARRHRLDGRDAEVLVPRGVLFGREPEAGRVPVDGGPAVQLS